jgi:hypothetical protein
MHNRMHNPTIKGVSWLYLIVKEDVVLDRNILKDDSSPTDVYIKYCKLKLSK